MMTSVQQVLSTTPRVVRGLKRHQRSNPSLWPSLASGVLALCNLALVWHHITNILHIWDNDEGNVVKGSEYWVYPDDIKKIREIKADVDAAAIKHGLTATLAAWSYPNVQHLDRAAVVALAKQQLTLSGLSISAIKDILGALYLPRHPVTLLVMEDEPIKATTSWVYKVFVTGETTQAQDNPDPTVMTGKWKTASTQGAVALLLVSMKRYKTAQIHLEAMAKTAQECILDNHWAKDVYAQVRQVLEDVQEARQNPDVDQVAAQLGNMGVQEPTIAEEVAELMAGMDTLDVDDDDTLLNRMLALATAGEAV